jgi:PKHD-type hydroxylase
MASFFWVQSMVKSAEQRMILLDLDNTIQNLTNQGADEHMVIKMTSVYHNLLRMWADA